MRVSYEYGETHECDATIINVGGQFFLKLLPSGYIINLYSWKANKFKILDMDDEEKAIVREFLKSLSAWTRRNM